MGSVEVDSIDKPRTRQPVVVLGLPDQIATDEQKKIVAELMGLEMSDLILVHISPLC
jgi:hypothetical protein